MIRVFWVALKSWPVSSSSIFSIFSHALDRKRTVNYKIRDDLESHKLRKTKGDEVHHFYVQQYRRNGKP